MVRRLHLVVSSDHSLRRSSTRNEELEPMQRIKRKLPGSSVLSRSNSDDVSMDGARDTVVGLDVDLRELVVCDKKVMSYRLLEVSYLK